MTAAVSGAHQPVLRSSATGAADAAGHRSGPGVLVVLALGAVAGEALSIWLTIAAFRAIGHAVYDLGRAPSWAAVALPLAGAAAAGAAATWLGGRLGTYLSTWSRRRTLALALRADIDETRRAGAGRALALAMDGDLLGSFLVATGPAGVLGLAEVGAAVAVALTVPAAAGTLGLVAAALAAGAVAAVALHRSRAVWSASRETITNRLVERLGALETIAIQGDTAAAAREGTALLAQHRRAGRRMDRAALVLDLIPIVSFVGLVGWALASSDPVGAGAEAETTLAVTLAAVYLAASGLGRLSAVAVDVVGALDAHRGIRRLAGSARPPTPEPATEAATALLRAEGVRAELPGGGGLQTPVDLTIEPGDRVVLVGPSGCGKTTLAEVIGLERAPTGGRVVRGAGVVVARVPQAGDDHLFQASLLFNVLCQRAWPPTSGDIDDAVQILDELGLGPLVDHMPAGLSQPIGDGGWRLSSGEAARVSLARALVRRPDVLILDETVAALGAARGTRALEVAAAHSRATVLIAHP